MKNFGLCGAATAALGAMTAAEAAKGRYMRAPDHGLVLDIKGKSPEEAADLLTKAIETKHTEVMKVADDALVEAKKSGALATETRSKVDELLTGVNTLREQLSGVEQKMARKPGPEDAKATSYGAQFVAGDAFAEFKAQGFKKSGGARMELKAITAANAVTWSQRDPEVVGLPKRDLVVRDLLTVVPTTSGSIDYAYQSVRTNNAAVVAEAAAKPYSNYQWLKANVPVRTIAHLAKVTRQALEDAVQLQGEIDQEMRFGLALAEEGELLFGDGTGEHLTGLVPAATAYVAPIAIDDATMIDTLRLAMLQAELALYPVDGTVMNPKDWAHIELTKDAQGRYIWADPLALGGRRMWGKPVVATPAMTVDKFLTGGFKLQTLYDRMEPEVAISSENADDFEKNLYTMRCEELLALAIKRALALIYGDFGNV
jgi:HK97 family phage major capsid protein